MEVEHSPTQPTSKEPEEVFSKKLEDVMTNRRMTVLVVGATGSIGRLVVQEVLREGHAVRALVRNSRKGALLPPEAQVVVGDVTRPDGLSAAVDGVDAIVFTLGSDGAGKAGAERVDYGGVRNVPMTAALTLRSVMARLVRVRASKDFQKANLPRS